MIYRKLLSQFKILVILCLAFNLTSVFSIKTFAVTDQVSNSKNHTSIINVIDNHTELISIISVPIEERIIKLNTFAKKYPQSPFIYQCQLALAQAYIEQGQEFLKISKSQAALEMFQKAVKTIPLPITINSFRSLILPICIVLASNGSRNESVSLMRNVENDCGKSAELLEQIGLFYLSVEDPTDAKQTLQKALELEPNKSNLHYTLGVAFQMNLRLDDAITEFSKALELDPQSKTAAAALADLYRANGSVKEAEKLYLQQLLIDPNHSTALGGLVLSLVEQNRDTEAVESLSKMLSVTSQDIRFFTQLAYYYSVRGELLNAHKIVEKARSIQPRYPWLRIVEANIKINDGDFAEAENILGEALETAKFPTLYFELGKTLVLANDFERAIEPFEAFLQINSEDEFEVNLGGVLKASGPSLDKLLASERRAAILVNSSLTSEQQTQQVERFVRFAYLLKQAKQITQSIKQPNKTPVEVRPRRISADLNKSSLRQAVDNFVSGQDKSRALRCLYAANQLIDANLELEQAEQLSRTAIELVPEAIFENKVLTDWPGLSSEMRLANLKLQAEVTLGWVLFKQGKSDEATSLLKNCVNNFHTENREKKAANWKLGVVLESIGKFDEALEAYRAGYDSNSSSASTQQAIIESLQGRIKS